MIDDFENFKLIDASFPHVGKKLKLFWGYPEFNAFMDDLQHDTRGGQRKGFSLSILLALHNLDSEHARTFPNLVRKSDIWGL